MSPECQWRIAAIERERDAALKRVAELEKIASLVEREHGNRLAEMRRQMCELRMVNDGLRARME